MCKGLGMHELQRREYLFCDVASFKLWYLPRACHHALLQVSKGHILHGKEDIGSVFEPAKELDEDSSLLEL